MLFTSLEFLLLFFPIVFGVNFLLPRKLKNYWLLLASLCFYAWGEPMFVLIMIGSIIGNYLLALWLNALRDKPAGKKAVLVLDLVLNLGLLFVFKYLNFLTANLHAWFPATESLFPVTKIALPIGISFFTFQALSYVIDVYRGDVPAQKNIGYLGLYISLFPQLIAGPIVRYSTVMDQITERKVTLQSFSEGMMRFMIGFNKKVLLANVLAEVADKAFARTSASAGLAWLGALCYALQILFDFSGYSDMAIGLGRMLGFRFLENFDYPYCSGSISEFWRRWHISLGTWFRDYVYFPLGGSRVGKGKLVRNLLIVWLLTGIWHGANWTFILWGLLYGFVIMIEKLTGLSKKLKDWHAAPRVLYRVLTLLLILLGWVLFRADDLPAAGRYYLAMLGQTGNAVIGNDFIFYSREYIVYLIAALVACTPLVRIVRKAIAARKPNLAATADVVGWVVQAMLFVVSITMLVMNAHNPFIYFNF